MTMKRMSVVSRDEDEEDDYLSCTPHTPPHSMPSPEDQIPEWLQKLLPSLTSNYAFKLLYVYISCQYARLTESFFIQKVSFLLNVLYPIYAPALTLSIWTLWILRTTVLRPCFFVIFKILSIIGITPALNSAIKKILAGLDYFADHLMTMSWKARHYIKGRWAFIKADFLLVLQKIKDLAKEALTNFVKVSKYLYSNFMELLKTMLPSDIYNWMESWLEFYVNFVTKTWYTIKHLFEAILDVITLIKDTWDETQVEPEPKDRRHRRKCLSNVVDTEASTSDISTSGPTTSSAAAAESSRKARE